MGRRCLVAAWSMGGRRHIRPRLATQPCGRGAACTGRPVVRMADVAWEPLGTVATLVEVGEEVFTDLPCCAAYVDRVGRGSAVRLRLWARAVRAAAALLAR